MPLNCMSVYEKDVKIFQVSGYFENIIPQNTCQPDHSISNCSDRIRQNRKFFFLIKKSPEKNQITHEIGHQEIGIHVNGLRRNELIIKTLKNVYIMGYTCIDFSAEISDIQIVLCNQRQGNSQRARRNAINYIGRLAKRVTQFLIKMG